MIVYKFDPTHWNGTVFSLASSEGMVRGWSEFRRNNQPIPASFFPRSLTFDDASAALPDIFHTTRGIIAFSEQAREVMERLAPGQVEFIPVACQAPPKIAARLVFDSAYYFINILGRAHRLQWLDMPTEQFPARDDGTEISGLSPNIHAWKLRERTNEEPLIWHEIPWLAGNRECSSHPTIFIEGVLWRELNADFPDQLNALRVGE